MGNGTERRYRNLVARARDQAGTPEGELCDQLAAKMRLLHGECLADADDLPLERHSIRWHEWHDRELIVWACEFFDLSPMKTSGSRAKLILVDCDGPTLALLDHAISSLRPRLDRLIKVTTAGFLTGALPHSYGGTETESSGEELSADELEAARAGMVHGRRHTPRKALTE